MADALAALVRSHQPDGTPLTVRIGHDTLSLEAAVFERARVWALPDAHAHNAARTYFKEYVIYEDRELLHHLHHSSLSWG